MIKRLGGKGIDKWVVAVGVIAAILIGGCASAAPSSTFDNAAPAPMAGAAEAPAAEPMAQADGNTETSTVSSNRKIIARAQMSLVVADTQEAVDSIAVLMDELGGYVSDSELYRRNDLLQGSITLRVPAENMDAALDALAEMAVEVNSRTVTSEDVTDQYSDVDAQIRNLEATERELLAMLEEVRERPNSTTEDIMSVYRTLTDVRGQIETLRGRKNMWDNLISLSTIQLNLAPDAANLPVVEDGWRPSSVAREAQRALVATVQVLGNVLIWVGIYVLPLLILAMIPLAVLIFAARWALRRLSKPKVAREAPSPTGD